MKPKACVVVASEMTVRTFLVAQLVAMQARYDITVVVNTANPAFLEDLGVIARLQALPIERAIAPLSDLRCLARLVRLMRRERFDLVHSITPKAGLLAMVAARIARVPVRIHTFTGQVWATRTGIARAVLRWLDKTMARAATFALADSQSQQSFLASERVVPASKIAVLANGSVSGVDATRFRRDPMRRRLVRESLGIPMTDVVLLFVGRINCDKGVMDLARAFAILADRRADIRLLVVGPDEEGLTGAIRDVCSRHLARLHFCAYTNAPEDFMTASDVLCLPSYREGFGTVIIEAAATGLPAVASRIYGVVDAVVDGKTGLLHEPADLDGLTGQLERLISDPELRRSLGTEAQARATRDFSQSTITSAVLDVYSRLLDVAPRNPGLYARHGKRAFDVVAASAGIVLLVPLAACLAGLIWYFLGAPVLFRQRRPGLHGVPFTLIKFRSMTEGYDSSGRLLPDSERLTTLGRWLRASSLDEVPELWHVLTGKMSLVGPRPLLMKYLPLYTPQQARRHDVRPGITGLAQVKGRNGLTWEERFELDLYYVTHCSLELDLRILARTALEVLARRGIAQPGRATVDDFQGTTSHG